MGHVLADSEEEESVPGLTLQPAMAQGYGLQPALLLDEMLERATEELDEQLDQMLQIPDCDTVQNEILEALAEANGSSSRIRPPCDKADAETVDEADSVTVNPETVGDSVTDDPVTVIETATVTVGDLYSVTFSVDDGESDIRHSRLMRISEVREWDRDDGVMVLIQDALQRGKNDSFPDLRGWIVLNRRNELFMHEDAKTSQFLPNDKSKYLLLSAKSIEDITQSLRQEALHPARLDAQFETQESAATRAERFSPTLQYLKAVPTELREETLRLAASGARGSAWVFSVASPELALQTTAPNLQPCEALGSDSGARGSADPPPRPPPKPLGQWRGEGPLPIDDMEAEARGLCQQWKVATLANAVFLQTIPLDRENEYLNAVRETIWLKAGMRLSSR